jgi:F420H(2)-dependent quinone reductase
VEGRTLGVHADQLDDAEASFWPRVLDAAPDYSRYPRRIGRLPPLLRLISASTPNASHRKEPA